MPQLIQHIDKIARDKQRDVLFLTFHANDAWHISSSSRDNPIRQTILNQLTQMGILWECCAEFANENGFSSYAGQLYIDLAPDKDDPLYQALEHYLETPDGHMRFENVNFYILPLEVAMRNVHHDEPGFWEKWASEW
jgi:hypothetical protein